MTTVDLSPELQQRMVALVRRFAASPMCAGDLHTMQEACAIVADPGFPAEVDGDLVEARRIACENSRWEPDSEQWSTVQEGRQDHIPMVKAALAALRRGKQMAGEA